jgi:flagellin-like hook-associated protein FlgL
MKTRAEIGSAKAFQGASGLNVNTGSAVDVRQSMTEIGYYDQQTIRANAAKTAWGYEVEATQDEAQGALYTMSASMDRMQAAAATTGAQMTRAALPLEQQAMGLAQTSGTIDTLSSLVGAGSSVADKWMKWGTVS